MADELLAPKQKRLGKAVLTFRRLSDHFYSQLNIKTLSNATDEGMHTLLHSSRSLRLSEHRRLGSERVGSKLSRLHQCEVSVSIIMARSRSSLKL